MEKTYNPKDIESKWYPFWESKGYFKANTTDATDKSYCIMLPPPNVTGSLHMGHAFQDSLMDLLVRYHRMRGFNTHWQMGCDHAGIATQMVVERQLNAQGLTKYDLGRDAFLDKIWAWKEESGGQIYGQMKRLGTSGDWDLQRFTMDEGLSKAVSKVFVQLFEEGLIYRGKRLVNWDPVLLTAVSDLEVNSEDAKGSLWHIRYPIVNPENQEGHLENKDYIVVATTRPETLLGDVAVAVHPEDARYAHLIGKMLKLPLTDRMIPIIADDYVKPEFGTGCVKITPAHDFNDHEIGKRHQLEMINILTPDAKLNENVPKAYQGLSTQAAREVIVEELSKLKLLDKIEAHELKIPRGDRTGAVIEPYLTDQWFVKVDSLAKPAIAAVESGDIKFVPENWSKTYFDWMYNIQDWCISRQLWWGHRIPAWYDDQQNIYVGESEASVRQKHQIPSDVTLKQDNDVLDTWFSSALWPFSTLGWPDKTPMMDNFYPTNVLVTGFDIIFFWVARMIMMGLKFTGKVPFDTVYVHGLIQDHEGQKMSKSKGNVIDPIDIIDGISLNDLLEKRIQGLMQPQMREKIEKATRAEFKDGIQAYGTDALRFTYCALATTGRHIRFDFNRVDGYSKFCNKIFNAARYVLMNTESTPENGLPASYDLSQIQTADFSLADTWIRSKLQNLIQNIHDHIKLYRFDLAAQELYEFTWNQYCDWYLELSKATLQDESSTPAQKYATRYTLVNVLETLLRIMHPFMPFITEEIWQKVKGLVQKSGDSIMVEPYPEFDSAQLNQDSIEALDWMQRVILGVRNIRGEMNLSPNKVLSIFLRNGTEQDKKLFSLHHKQLCSLAKIDKHEWLEDKAPPPSATAIVGQLEILIPLADIIDKEAETIRLNKELTKQTLEFNKCTTKLNNEGYVNKAPEQVVAKERERVQELEIAIQTLKEKLKELETL